MLSEGFMTHAASQQEANQDDLSLLLGICYVVHLYTQSIDLWMYNKMWIWHHHCPVATRVLQ